MHVFFHDFGGFDYLYGTIEVKIFPADRGVMLKKIALGIIILVVLVLNVLRFWKLDTIPYGYHWDEAGSAVTMQCFTQMGCDAELTPWPLFGQMEYGQDKPPTYVYPGMLWEKVFGTTVASLRGFSVFGLLMGILGLYFFHNCCLFCQ